MGGCLDDGVDGEEDYGEGGCEEGCGCGVAAGGLSPEFVDGHAVKNRQLLLLTMDVRTYVVEISESRSWMP